MRSKLATMSQQQAAFAISTPRGVPVKLVDNECHVVAGCYSLLRFALHPPKAAAGGLGRPGAPRSGTSRPGWFRQGAGASALGLG